MGNQDTVAVVSDLVHPAGTFLRLQSGQRVMVTDLQVNYFGENRGRYIGQEFGRSGRLINHRIWFCPSHVVSVIPPRS